jgi:Fe2+ or Zn2+ uptake regulation protein
VADNGVDAVAVAIARESGYRVDSHRLELFGLCPACLAA